VRGYRRPDSRQLVAGEKVQTAHGLDLGKKSSCLSALRKVEERTDDFEAVELGYTLEQVTAEADRCLRCHRPILVVT
jgi:hypothetical protein